MTKAIFLKEISEGIYGYKFLLVLVTSTILIPLAMYSGASSYKEGLKQYRQATMESEQNFRNQKPKGPHDAAHFGRTISKPPAPLMAMSSGIHDALGVKSQIDPHFTPRLSGSRYDATPILSIFGHFDFAFIIQTIFSLLAIVYSFNLISGEKEAGTLRLIFSNAVSRNDVLVGKVLGGLVLLFAPMTLATLIGLVFLTPLFGVSLDSVSWWRLLLILGASALYISLIFLLGVFVSTRTTRTMNSFIILLLIWASLNFVIPRVAVTVAQSVYRIPSVQEIDMQVEGIRREESEKLSQRIQAYRASHPESKDKPLPPETAIQARQSMDEALEERESKLMQGYEAAKWSQVHLAINLSQLSPASAYTFAVMELAGTGIYRHNRFLQYLGEFQKGFRSHFDNLERQNVRTVDRFDNVPEASFSEESTSSVIGRIIPETGLIGVLTVILFAGAYFSFVRYDVR
ncbi:MAG: ABC transporter permease subunit [Acidobacteriota bacterium]